MTAEQTIDSNTSKTRLQEAAQRGIDLCRAGKWKAGMDILGRIAEADRQGTELPGLFYSYLGYGIARYEKRGREGLALCQHAIKVQFYEPENYVLLARVYLLRHRRGKAIEALQKALQLNARHPEAVKLAREIGFRRRPVLPFLSRSHPINKALGKLRHSMSQGKAVDPEGNKI
jgi:tetratricopeptide (TPR) repeat protein